VTVTALIFEKVALAGHLFRNEFFYKTSWLSNRRFGRWY